MDSLGYEGKRATSAAFATKVEVTRDEMSRTVVVDPIVAAVTTTEQTLACSLNSKYSFVVVEL